MRCVCGVRCVQCVWCEGMYSVRCVCVRVRTVCGVSVWFAIFTPFAEGIYLNAVRLFKAKLHIICVV